MVSHFPEVFFFFFLHPWFLALAISVFEWCALLKFPCLLGQRRFFTSQLSLGFWMRSAGHILGWGRGVGELLLRSVFGWGNYLSSEVRRGGCASGWAQLGGWLALFPAQVGLQDGLAIAWLRWMSHQTVQTRCYPQQWAGLWISTPALLGL